MTQLKTKHPIFKQWCVEKKPKQNSFTALNVYVGFYLRTMKRFVTRFCKFTMYLNRNQITLHTTFIKVCDKRVILLFLILLRQKNMTFFVIAFCKNAKTFTVTGLFSTYHLFRCILFSGIWMRLGRLSFL